MGGRAAASRRSPSTKRGFEDVVRALAEAARTSAHVERHLHARARVEGNDIGYGTIAAAGEHACTLHWMRNDGDAAARRARSCSTPASRRTALYTADITRTLPVSGRFTEAQRRSTSWCSRAGGRVRRVRAGRDFLESATPRDEGARRRGCDELGTAPTADEALRTRTSSTGATRCTTSSHMLGLDVHDCAQARAEAYKYGKLKPGMVLTVEPGLYFQAGRSHRARRSYRGIGVRIEDDVVVTEDGIRNLSTGLPRRAAEIEDWLASLGSG